MGCLIYGKYSKFTLLDKSSHHPPPRPAWELKESIKVHLDLDGGERESSVASVQGSVLLQGVLDYNIHNS